MKLGRRGTALAAVGAYVALRIAFQFVNIGHLDKRLLTVIGFVSILAFMLVQIAVIPAVVRTRPNIWLALLAFIAGALGMAAVQTVGRKAFPGGSEFFFIANNLAIMLTAIPLGYVVSFIFREPQILLPVGIVAAMVDYWNVVVGPLGYVVQKHPEIVDKVSVNVPTPTPSVFVPSSIGGGDIVFLAMFFAVIYRFGMDAKRAFWLGYVLLTISLFLAYLFPVPALVPMGIAILVTNIRFFKLTRDELASTVLVMGLVAGLLLWLTKQLPVIIPMITGK